MNDAATNYTLSMNDGNTKVFGSLRTAQDLAAEMDQKVTVRDEEGVVGWVYPDGRFVRV